MEIFLKKLAIRDSENSYFENELARDSAIAVMVTQLFQTLVSKISHSFLNLHNYSHSKINMCNYTVLWLSDEVK